MALTASAGPAANLVLALLSAVAVGLLFRFVPGATIAQTPYLSILLQLLGLNVTLAVFNLIPVPPLDGSRILAWLLPPSMQAGWRQLEQLAPLLLIGLLMWGGRIAAAPINALYRQLQQLIYLIA
jgi:Zn-dependent protease